MTFQNKSEISDRLFEAWFRNHYLLLVLVFLFVFIGLAILAPVLLKVGIIFPAKAIYWMDGFFCHQLPFRSWFLFGVQPYYPLASAGINNMLSFEDYFRPNKMDFGILRDITGNSSAGYKMAICQRDIAMYLSLFMFGLLFVVNDRKIRKLPLWIWIVFGVIPIAIDGGVQLFGSLDLPIISAVVHESTPLLRTVTGSLFGLFTGWYIFPALDSIINKNTSEKSEI